MIQIKPANLSFSFSFFSFFLSVLRGIHQITPLTNLSRHFYYTPDKRGRRAHLYLSIGLCVTGLTGDVVYVHFLLKLMDKIQSHFTSDFQGAWRCASHLGTFELNFCAIILLGLVLKCPVRKIVWIVIAPYEQVALGIDAFLYCAFSQRDATGEQSKVSSKSIISLSLNIAYCGYKCMQLKSLKYTIIHYTVTYIVLCICEYKNGLYMLLCTNRIIKCSKEL